MKTILNILLLLCLLTGFTYAAVAQTTDTVSSVGLTFAPVEDTVAVGNATANVDQTADTVARLKLGV